MVAELQHRIANDDGYSIFANSCSSNVADVLDIVDIQTRGPWQFGTISPVDILNNLPISGRVERRKFYGRQ